MARAPYIPAELHSIQPGTSNPSGGGRLAAAPTDTLGARHEPQAGSRPYRVPGGQQQRVLLAGALCATEKMILLDEPVSGLDPRVTAQMYAAIEALNRRDGITTIMISHDVAAAVRYASHILHIEKTVFYGTKAEYLQSPQGKLFAAQKGGEAQ